MLDHMKKPHTKVTLLFEGPSDRHGEAIAALKSLGFNIAGEDRERIPWREAFKEFEGNEAGHNLAGGRHKEALTHVQLSKLTGIPSMIQFLRLNNVTVLEIRLDQLSPNSTY